MKSHLARGDSRGSVLLLSLLGGIFRLHVVYIEASCTSFSLRDFFVVYRSGRLSRCRLRRRGRSGGWFGYGCRRLGDVRDDTRLIKIGANLVSSGRWFGWRGG